MCTRFLAFINMTPNEQLTLILGRLLIAHGGNEFVSALAKEYKNGLERERFDRARLKEMLLKAISFAERMAPGR